MANTIKNLITRKRFATIGALEIKLVTYNAIGLISDDELADLIVYAREVYEEA